MTSTVINDATTVTSRLVREYIGIANPSESKMVKLELKASMAQAEENNRCVKHLAYCVASAIFGFTVLVCSITIFTIPPSALFLLSCSSAVYHGINLILTGNNKVSIQKYHPARETTELQLLTIMKGHMAYLKNVPDARQSLHTETKQWIHILYAQWDVDTIARVSQLSLNNLSPSDQLVCVVDTLVRLMPEKKMNPES